MINLAFAALAIVGFVSPQASGSWINFNSKLFPYSIKQPLSFRHVVLLTDQNVRVDYFAPALGSYTTSVTISANHGHVVNSAADMHARSGQNIRADGKITILNHKMSVTRASFHGLAGSWVEEQVSLSAGGYAWRLTASYDTRYEKLRGVMLQMLQSFKLRTPTSTHHK